MPDTNQLSARKEKAPTTPISKTVSTPLKTVTTSEKPVEKNIDDGSDIELEIAKIKAEIKRQRLPQILLYLWLIGSIIGFILSIIWIAHTPNTMSDMEGPSMSLVFSFFSLVGALSCAIGWQLQIISLHTEMDVLNTKKRVAHRFPEDFKEITEREAGTKTSEQPPITYFDRLVKLNVENLEAYYILVRHHTDKSFMVSIVVGIIGLSLIVVGLVIGFLTPAKTPTLSYIASASGIITDFIAGVFFYLYNRTVRQMKEYHDSLLSVQNVLLAFKIIGETQNETNKMDMVSRLLTYLMKKQDISATFSNVSLNGTKE